MTIGIVARVAVGPVGDDDVHLSDVLAPRQAHARRASFPPRIDTQQQCFSPLCTPARAEPAGMPTMRSLLAERDLLGILCGGDPLAAVLRL